MSMLTKVITAAVLLFSSCAALAQARDGAMLQNADADHDGKVTRQEFTTARAAQFGKLDRNGDGFLDDSDGGGRANRPQARQLAGTLRARLDTDGDGKVSREEFVNGPTSMFDQLDTNHDDVLDAKELEAARTHAKERLQERRQQ